MRGAASRFICWVGVLPIIVDIVVGGRPPGGPTPKSWFRPTRIVFGPRAHKVLCKPEGNDVSVL